jgi:hypothetical protein
MVTNSGKLVGDAVTVLNGPRLPALFLIYWNAWLAKKVSIIILRGQVDMIRSYGVHHYQD